VKRVRLVLVVLALAALAGPAEARETSVVQVFGVPTVPGETVLSQLTIPAQLQGELVVSFHGDAAAGCATYGVCAYSGTIVVRPRDGEVSVVTLRRHGRMRHLVLLDLSSNPMAYVTSARVQRSVPGGPAATCADAASPLIAQTTGVVRGRSVTLRVLDTGGSLLETRCAGPLDGDLSNAGPAATISLGRLRRGRTALDFGATSALASHGFVGTISSTLEMRLGKPQFTRVGLPPGTKLHRTRLVTESLRLVRVRGRLSATIRGSADPTVCELLDSCGVSGTLSLSDVRRDATAEVLAVGPARRPYRDFLTALGLSRSGRSRGIAVDLIVSWTGGVRATVNQAGGTCTGTASTGGVSFGFGLGTDAGEFEGSWRTRCPGPIFSNGSQALTASFDRAALGHREFSVGMRASGSLADDGYVIVPHGGLSVLLGRGRVTQQVFSEPAG
jgi:hypothetical protein